MVVMMAAATMVMNLWWQWTNGRLPRGSVRSATSTTNILSRPLGRLSLQLREDTLHYANLRHLFEEGFAVRVEGIAAAAAALLLRHMVLRRHPLALRPGR